MIQTHLRSIDGIRAFAVIVVILYHFFPGLVPNGFLGVDVFFVVSGFVISRSFWYWRSQGAVSFLLEFYARRLRRLLPALAVCISVTCVLMVLLAARLDLAALFTAGAAIFGVSNLLLNFLAQDYFALDAQLNPFTHTWSLGVEEQFYLIFPVLALLLGLVGGKAGGRRGAALGVCVGLALGSMATYLFAAQSDGTAAFYLPFYRLWELLAGVIAWQISRPDAPPRRMIAATAPVVVAVLALWPAAGMTFVTVPVVVLTAVTLSQIEAAATLLPNRALAMEAPGIVGRISYSLYLYHWPFYVLAGLSIGHSPAALCATLAMTVILAVLSYRFVETPFRRSWRGVPNFGVIALSLAVMLSTALTVTMALPAMTGGKGGLLFSSLSIWEAPEAVDWPEYECLGPRLALLEDPIHHCLSAERNGIGGDLFLLGDSHATQLLPLLRDMEGETFRKVYFINTENEGDFPRSFLSSGGIVQDRLLEHVLDVADYGDYLLIAFHRGRLNEVRDRHIPLSRSVDLGEKGSNFMANLRPWLVRMEARGMRVIFFGDTPLLSQVTAIESCLLQTRLFGYNDCVVNRTQDLHTRRRQDLLFRSFADEFDNAAFYDPAPYLFDGEAMFDPIAPNGNLRMIDWHHLTVASARAMAGDFRDFLRVENWLPVRAQLTLPATPPDHR
jgi:peptidoglycan/LPS O-acetylase OafA/YrhL